MADLATQLGIDPSLKKKKTKKTVSLDDFGTTTTTSTPAEGEDSMFAGLKKKKKKAAPLDLEGQAASAKEDTETAKEDADDSTVSSSSSAPDSANTTTTTDDLSSALGDMSLKKKKKKKKVVVANIDDFEKELAKAGVDTSKLEEPQNNNTSTATATADSSKSGSPAYIDNVSSQRKMGLPYPELLSRFFDILKENNPELAGERSGVKFRIPPPICQRDGKKSIFVNIQDICEKLQRPTDHLIQYLFAELGTSGSVDGQKRLVIKGKFLSKQMEGVLRRYIIEYVTCKTCKSINTELKKEQSNRLFFLVCKSCGSTRSVSSIKSGFQATVKRIRK